MSAAHRIFWALGSLVLLSPAKAAEPAPAPQEQGPQTSLVRTVDLDVGQSQEIELTDGSRTRLKLLDLQETRDAWRNAVRESRVKIEINGVAATLTSAMYHLPVIVAGVQIDCPITRGLTENSSKQNVWGLVRAARFRLWPAGSPLMEPGTFRYPVRQRWFASDTQLIASCTNHTARGGF
jgi:hypothetical protein